MTSMRVLGNPMEPTRWPADPVILHVNVILRRLSTGARRCRAGRRPQSVKISLPVGDRLLDLFLQDARFQTMTVFHAGKLEGLLTIHMDLLTLHNCLSIIPVA